MKNASIAVNAGSNEMISAPQLSPDTECVLHSADVGKNRVHERRVNVVCGEKNGFAQIDL